MSVAGSVSVAAGVLLAMFPAGPSAARAATIGGPAPGASRVSTPGIGPTPSLTTTAPPDAVTFSGTRAVGALFAVTRTRLRHFCTAAVVRSMRGNLVITAAHCLEGRHIGQLGNVIFAPGYHDGRFPHGRWKVMSAIVDQDWRLHRDPNDDVAFLLVGRHGRRIQRYAGAETVATGLSLPRRVRVIGYPDQSNAPVRCTGRATALTLKGYRQMVFDCGGFTNGTSGGPFLTRVSARPGYGAVIGVIGGYQLGGKLARISYSARFLRNIADLYRRARQA